MIHIRCLRHLQTANGHVTRTTCLSPPVAARFGGVHAFGYESAEREPIWMKSGAL